MPSFIPGQSRTRLPSRSERGRCLNSTQIVHSHRRPGQSQAGWPEKRGIIISESLTSHPHSTLQTNRRSWRLRCRSWCCGSLALLLTRRPTASFRPPSTATLARALCEPYDWASTFPSELSIYLFCQHHRQLNDFAAPSQLDRLHVRRALHVARRLECVRGAEDGAAHLREGASPSSGCVRRRNGA